MKSHIRIRAYWPARSDTLARSEQQLHALLATLTWLDEKLGAWSFEDESGKIVAADSPARCGEALAQAEMEWKSGRDVQKCSQPRLFTGPVAAPSGELTMTCGIKPMKLGPIFAPNRIDLLLRATPDNGWGKRELLEDVVRAIAAVFRPSFAFVGSLSVPAPPEPLSSDGTPAVGWMTYLSAEYPKLPALAKPAETLLVGQLGALVVAQPDPFDEREQKHLQAIRAVRDALSAAAVLVPDPAMPKPAA